MTLRFHIPRESSKVESMAQPSLLGAERDVYGFSHWKPTILVKTIAVVEVGLGSLILDCGCKSVIQCLLSICEALGSVLSIGKHTHKHTHKRERQREIKNNYKKSKKRKVYLHRGQI